MRRTLQVLLVLALATLACNLAGVEATQPVSSPVADSGGQLPPATAEPVQPQPQPSGPVPDELAPDRIDQITRAAVQIVAAQSLANMVDPLWTGSGTIISPTGEIVTNCHVACGAPVLIIMMTENADQPPQPRYVAEISHYDEMLDLALLRIVTDTQGNPVSPTDLPYLELGDSTGLRLGDKLFIFGYPGVGGATITFTTGAVSGFESADVGGSPQRVIIKTDAQISSGNSGGTATDPFGRLVAIPTAVNPDVREGVTLGGLGILRPANLIEIVRQQAGSPPPLEGAGLPPADDPDPFEPNETLDTATGPLAAGDVVTAYISWAEDADVYWIEPSTAAPISVTLNMNGGVSGIDYDLYLLDRSGQVVAASESETSNEFIEYLPPAVGRYWIAVLSYSGASTSSPYTLSIAYDGGVGGSPAGGGVAITGQAVDGNTGRPLPGGLFGILQPDVTCAAFFSRSELDMRLVVASGETNNAGVFQLNGVPRGVVYPAFFIFNGNYICENAWLEVPADAVDSDIGVIEMSFN